jgi:hypothetical protein
LGEDVYRGISFVDSVEEMMKTRSCLKIFGSLNYLVELFKVQSNPNFLIVTQVVIHPTTVESKSTT